METYGEIKQRRLQRLRCSAQNYDWGKIGRESIVARLLSLNSGVEIDDQKPYAEIWIGAHDSLPSFVVKNDDENENMSLKVWIARNPDVLGDKVVEKFGNSLPFLFKVLSVAKALSIQAHPDKKLAAILHKLQPDVYKDDNHKPEMVLALTDFEALCGFISLEDLVEVLQNVPEIIEVVGIEHAKRVIQINDDDAEEKVKPILQAIFTQLMSANKVTISQALSRLISRLNMESEVRELNCKEELALRLEKQYPDDVGIIAAFLFNYVKLKPGEALYLGANELHAYLYGECIECMATSDNVVRAGLTPKNRDVKILCNMLTYKQGFPEILRGIKLNQYTSRYIPPFEEFEVDRCILPAGESVIFPANPSLSIFLVVVGKGRMNTTYDDEIVSEGDVIFAPANMEIIVTTSMSELHLYRAGVNSRTLL